MRIKKSRWLKKYQEMAHENNINFLKNKQIKLMSQHFIWSKYVKYLDNYGRTGFVLVTLTCTNFPDKH